MGTLVKLGILLVASTSFADTVPCSHRSVEKKTIEFFDHVQASRKTGFHARALEGVRETGQAALPENDALRRFCEAELLVDNGDKVHIYVAVTSRDTFKRDRAEDVQSCWEAPRYGEPAVIGASSGCAPLKAPARK